jgi:hypothetical protein
MKPWILRMDTSASTTPFTTQGKALSGAMRMLKSAREVKADRAVSGCPSSTTRPKVKRVKRVEVAAQK